MKVSTPIHIKAGELRLGDIYVTRGGGITVKREVIGRRETVAADAEGDPQAAVELTCSDGTSPMLLLEQMVKAERELRPLGQSRTTIAASSPPHTEGLHDELAREFCPECETAR